MFTSLKLLALLGRRLVAGRADLVVENLALRHQLAVYQRRQKRPQLTDRDRLFWSILARVWPRWRGSLVIVQPATVVRWH